MIITRITPFKNSKGTFNQQDFGIKIQKIQKQSKGATEGTDNFFNISIN